MNRRTVLSLALALMTIVVSVYGAYYAITNTYSKPIREAEKIANAKPDDYDSEALMGNAFGGLGKSQLTTIAKVMENSESLSPALDAMQTSFSSMIDNRTALYGEDCTVKYTVESKTELPISELQKAKAALTEQGERFVSFGEFFESLTDEQIANMTEASGITEEDLEDLADALTALGKEIAGVQISAGYRLELTRTVTDADDTQLDQETLEVTVLNINGEWLVYDYENGGGFMLDSEYSISPAELEQMLEPLRNI